ncbi:MAG: FixH family protein [Acetobacteraceae bacterium]|nr:FixH family protein [Acetobacteraceae bacterium]
MQSIALAALVALPLGACASWPEASAPGYRMELAEAPVRAGRDAELRVRLRRSPGGEPVAGAVFTDHRFEMSMPRFKTVTSTMVEGRDAPPSLAQEEAGGVYRVHASLPMAGSWQAVLTARVPGEERPVRERLSVPVVR